MRLLALLAAFLLIRYVLRPRSQEVSGEGYARAGSGAVKWPTVTFRVYEDGTFEEVQPWDERTWNLLRQTRPIQ